MHQRGRGGEGGEENEKFQRATSVCASVSISDKPGAEGSTETDGGSHGNHPEKKRMKVSGAERDCTQKISQVHAVGLTARTKETFAGGREAFS